MRADLKSLGFRRVRRLVCGGQHGSCDLGEVWRTSRYVAVRTQRRPSPRVVEIGHDMKQRGHARAPKGIELVVMFTETGAPAPTKPEAWGLDPDEQPSDDDARWKCLAFAFHGRPFAVPVELWCSRHKTRSVISGHDLVALTSNGEVTPVVVPAR